MTDETLYYIEYEDGHPFSAMTVDERKRCCEYDIAWCRRDATPVYRQSGSGGDPRPCPVRGNRYWLAPGLALYPEGRGTPLAAPPPEVVAGVWPPADWAEGEFTWCDDCRDWLPEDAPCEHFRWCPECGCWWPPAPAGVSVSDAYVDSCEHLTMPRRVAVARCFGRMDTALGLESRGEGVPLWRW